MSMLGNFVRISAPQLQTLLAAPEQISSFLYDNVYREEPDAELLEIDKSWQLIHFLLTGDSYEGPYPLCAVVLGGDELGEEDVGYGPARYMAPAQVQEVAEAVCAISDEELWNRFDADRVLEADIYPQSWSDADRDYVCTHFSALKRFYAAAAASDQAVLQFLN